MFQAPLSPYNRTRSKKCSLSYGVSRKLACRKPLRRAWTSGASCQPRLWVGSILVLIFPPKTKAIAVPRHSPSMKRSQKYLWRPSGLDLPGERMKDSNRPEGILELAEGPATHLWSPVVSGIGWKIRIWRTPKLGVDCHRGDLWACEVSIPTGNQIIQITRKEWEEWVPEKMDYHWQKFGVASASKKASGWDEGSRQPGKCVQSPCKFWEYLCLS